MDTIVIRIYGPRNFGISDVARTWFKPELKSRKYKDLTPTEKESTFQYLRHFAFHPVRQNRYLPQIEVFEQLNKERTNIQYMMKLRFSVAKLLYKNSIEEAPGDNLDEVLAVLERVLAEAGIYIKQSALAKAPVSQIDVCKNVILPPEIRLQSILKEIGKLDITKAEDVTNKKEKNGGRWLQLYSRTVGHTFYDKVADAMRPKGKRDDKWEVKDERAVIERFGLEKTVVFRYEHRLKHGQTVMRDINRALGREPKTSVLFKDLFTPGLCQKLLVGSWEKLVERPENQLALFGPISTLVLLHHMFKSARKMGGNGHSMNRAFTSYGIARAMNEHGAKEVKTLVSEIWSSDHPERLTKKVKLASELASGIKYSDAIAYIDAAIRKYELLTRKKLEDGLQ